MRSFCNYGDLELSRSSELKAKMRRINYEIQATADTRSTNGAVVSALACHQGDPGSNPSGGSLGRMLTMGTDERQESCTDDRYNPERALSTDACKNDGILTSQVEQKSKREKESLTQPQKLGVRHPNLQSTTTLVDSKVKARQHTAMSLDREKATSRLH